MPYFVLNLGPNPALYFAGFPFAHHSGPDSFVQAFLPRCRLHWEKHHKPMISGVFCNWSSSWKQSVIKSAHPCSCCICQAQHPVHSIPEGVLRNPDSHGLYSVLKLGMQLLWQHIWAFYPQEELLLPFYKLVKMGRKTSNIWFALIELKTIRSIFLKGNVIIYRKNVQVRKKDVFSFVWVATIKYLKTKAKNACLSRNINNLLLVCQM